MTIRFVLLIGTALLVLRTAAIAEPLVDTTQHFRIEIPEQFAAIPAGTSLHRYSSESGMRLSLSRIDAANLRAYWRNERKDFFAELERGAAQTSTGYRLRSKKDGREGRTPIFDLHFERDNKGKRELVWMRFVLYRRYAIVATVTAPAKAPRQVRKAGANLAASLGPYTNSTE